MNNTVRLQIPMSKTLKVKGMNRAKKLGYTSLQEVIRVFVTSFADKQVIPTFESRERLSTKAEKRYNKMIREHEKDRKAGKTKSFTTAKEAVKFLNSNE